MRLRTQLLLGFLLVFALMIIIASVTYKGTTDLINTSKWVSHTHSVIGKAHLIEKLLVDMETGQRGFLITGNDDFLEPYNDGIAAYEETMSALMAQVSDNPSQVDALRKIDTVVADWHKLAARPEIEERRKIAEGTIDAEYLQTVLSEGVGKGILDKMRVLMDDMKERFRKDGNIKGVSLIIAFAKAMVDQETGQRGFLVTGKDEFLQPYRQGQIDLKQHVSALHRLLGNAHNRIATDKHLNELERLSEKWLKEVGRPEIDLRRQCDAGTKTQQDIEQRLVLGEGKSIVDAMRVVIASLDESFTAAENQLARTYMVLLVKAMVDQETGQRGFLLTGKDNFLEPYLSGQKLFKQTITDMRALNANAYDIAAMKADLQQLEQLAVEWKQKAAVPEINARLKMNTSTLSLKTVRRMIEAKTGKNIFDDLRLKIGAFVEVEKGLLKIREKDSAASVDLNISFVFFGTLLAIVLGVIGMLFVTRSILTQVGGEPADIAALTEQIASGDLNTDVSGATGILGSVGEMVGVLKQVTEQANVIATGDYTSDVKPRSDVDELGIALQSMTQTLRDNRDQAERDDWLKSGIAQLNEVMRGDPTIESLSTAVITELATYLNAQIGAFFIVEDEEEVLLRLQGTYAYTQRKNVSNVFKLGEGLVGQAALEKQQIVIEQVPEDYITVTSSLGEHVPHFICVTPILYEDKIRGVIEIALFEALNEQQLQYLSQAAIALAIAVESAQSRTDLAESLKESQQLSEELQTQQEELKSANEELEEQTQRLVESEKKLKAQQEELQVTNEELEEKHELLEKQNTEVQKAKLQVEEQAEEVALASKYKSEFLANMSHELRTPLNSLLLLAQGLAQNKDGNLDEDQVQSARIIHSSGSDLLNLINEILDLSKIEAGRMEIQASSVRLQDVATSIRQTFTHVAEEGGNTLKVEVGDDAPMAFVTDRQRLEQIIKNLLSNAIKFTENGTVTVQFNRPLQGVDLSRSGLHADNSLAIAVSDTGIGIDAEQQRVIFEAFQQADGGTSRKYGGTGLGLSISRELANLLHGEIQLHSSPGEGSTFTLYIPLDLAQVAQVPTQNLVSSPVGSERPTQQSAPMTIPKSVADDRDAIKKDDRRILVIEDDSKFAQLLLDKCHDKDFKCLVAATGEEGLELAKEFMPNAIMLDIQLPGMDGLAVLAALKDDIHTRHIPVHIMSVDEYTSAAMKAGAVGYAVKPLDLNTLEQAFTKLEQFSEGQSRSVLVVEDDEKIRQETVSLLSGKNITVDEAATGEEAINKLRDGSYDCVVLDLILPDSHGDVILNSLEQEGVALPPVIIHTASDLSRDEEVGLREFAESIVIKDVRSQERLLDEVSLFLHQVVSKMPQKKRKIIRDLHDTDDLLQGKKVLLVEDDMRTSFAMARLLSERGMIAVKAENGEKALKQLEEHPDITLVLMDIMMPVMDGYETMQKIREQDAYAKLPIIALTAKAMPEDREKCLAVGANDYLPKPVDTARLISLIRVWLYR